MARAAAEGAVEGHPPLFVSWIRHHGRSQGICDALGAECVFVAVGRLTDRRTAPLRHLVQAVRTGFLLARRRPRVLWVMAPPTTLVILALIWRAFSRCRLVIDAHTGAVLDPTRSTQKSVRLLCRADLVVVTTPRLATMLRARGVSALPLHDPPLDDVPPVAPSGQVIMPASWYSDEPWQDVAAAAALLPDVPVVVTGRPPASLDTDRLPANLRLTGYLNQPEYERLVQSASVVLALTTREDTMQRAAYEAVAAGRPVVASGTAALRDYLSDAAQFTTGGAEDLATAIRSALEKEPQLTARMATLREEHRRQFRHDLAAVDVALLAQRGTR